MQSMWRPLQPLPTARLRQLLQARGSFTAKLRSLTAAAVRVRVLHQGWSPHAPRRYLREVVLHDGAVDLVYALTELPAIARCGAHQGLRCLAERPLGELLFGPGGSRLLLQQGRLTPQCRLARQLQKHALDRAPALPARRSLFRYKGSAILVHEVLLPALLQRLGPKL